MGTLLAGALIRALLNERVVDRLFALVGQAVEAKNNQQTRTLQAHVDSLHRQNVARFEHLEAGLHTLERRVYQLELARLGLADQPEPDEEA